MIYINENIAIKGAVFDMDGLLLDTETIYDKAWFMAGEQLKLSNIESAINHCRGFNFASIKEFFSKTYGHNFDFDGFYNLTEIYAHKIFDNGVPLMTGALEILKFLKNNNISLAVASSSNRSIIIELLTKNNIIDYFSCIVGGDEVKFGKPNPEIYILASNMLKLNPNECIALEDSNNGIISASKAGMFTVHIPDRVPPNPETDGLVWKRFDSLLECKNFLRNSKLCF